MNLEASEELLLKLVVQSV